MLSDWSIIISETTEALQEKLLDLNKKCQKVNGFRQQLDVLNVQSIAVEIDGKILDKL